MAIPDLSTLRIDRQAQTSAGRSRLTRRHWVNIGITIALLALAAVAAISHFHGTLDVDTATVGTAYPSQNYTLLNATGYVTPQRKAAVSSKATGRLEWLGVLEGSRVTQGELIARLENRDVSAALDQAAANVQVAQANREQAQAELRDAGNAYRRSQELLAQKFISSATNDAAAARFYKAKAAIASARAAITAAQANRQAAQVALEQTLIRAPFDGVVLTKNANVGDNITPFSSATDSKGAVVTIADMDTLEVEADVSESNIAKIRVDQPCEIQLEAFPELRLAGRVSRMVPTVDRSKATLLVKVRFVERDPRVLPDMSAKVAFLSRPVPPNEKQPVTAVQPTAIVKRGGKKVVFAVSDGKVRQMPVAVGQKIGELVQVQGIPAGTRVVLDPPGTLKDGAAVAVAKK